MSSLSHKINIENELGEIINYLNHLKRDQGSSLFLINIANKDLISSLYGDDFIDNIINNLTNKISNSFKDQGIFHNIASKYILAFVICEKSEAESFAQNIYNIIQINGSNRTDNPYHLISYISSISIPDDVNDPTKAIDYCFDILKCITSDVDTFYYPYENDLDIKNSFKKKFILAHHLKNAIFEKKLKFAFQPIIKSETGEAEHYESLLRIVKDDGKIISAGPFIQIAEEMGFVNLIDDLVLEMVVEELNNHPEVSLSVNLSGHGINNNQWLLKSKKLLKNSQIATRLIIEITETVAQKDLSKSAYFIASLQDMGCKVALDDFGAGYTSFRQLKALPIDIIKIDGSFIRDIAENSNNLLFVKTIINMSKEFGFKSIAEFVETGQIAKKLIELKVDYMQGNYFCPAVNYRNWKCD